MENLELSAIAHGGAEYNQAVTIRYNALRKPIGLDFSEEQLAAEAPFTHLAAKYNGKVVACLYLVPLNDDEIRVRQFAVDEQVHRRGIGRRLLNYAEEVAKTHGFNTVILHARLEAIGFYAACGYETEGEAFKEVTLPHIKMVRGIA